MSDYKYVIEYSENGRTWKKLKEYSSKKRAEDCIEEELRYQQMGWIDPTVRYRMKSVKKTVKRK